MGKLIKLELKLKLKLKKKKIEVITQKSDNHWCFIYQHDRRRKGGAGQRQIHTVVIFHQIDGINMLADAEFNK